MGLFSALKGLLQPSASRNKFTSALLRPMDAGQAYWGYDHIPTHRLLREYRGAGYACTNIIAQALASLDFRVMVAKPSAQALKLKTRPVSSLTKKYIKHNRHLRQYVKEEDGAEEIVDPRNPLVEMFKKVNPFWNTYDFFESWSLTSNLAGKFAAYKVRDPTGMVSELWPIPIHRLHPVLDRNEFIRDWEYRVGTEKRIFPAEDIIYHRRVHPLDPVDGFAPLRGTWDAAQASAKLQEYENALLNNRAVPDVIAIAESQISWEDRKNAIEKWNHQFGGANQGGFGIIGPNVSELREMGFSPKDMENTQALSAMREHIANGFGIPVALLTAEGSNQATHHTSMIQLGRFAVNPQATRIAESINQYLVPEFDDTGQTFVMFDNAVPEDDERLANINVAYVTAKIMTKNEARADLGLPPLEGGDSIEAESPFGDINPLDSNPDEPEKGYRERPGQQPKDRELIRGLKHLFEMQQRWLVSQVEGIVFEKAENENAPLTEIRKLLAAFADEWQTAAESVIGGTASLNFFEGARIGEQELGKVGIAFDLTDRAALAFLQTRATKILRRLARGINDTTARRIVGQLEEAIKDGENINQITNRVKSVFRDASTKRARVIARTETKRALEAGRLASYESAGVQELEWVPDDDPCEYCEALRGARVPISGHFGRGSLEGVDGGTLDLDGTLRHPPAHPNCECVLVPVVD